MRLIFAPFFLIPAPPELTKHPTVPRPGINQVTLLGRVGTEPTVKGSDENPLISFSLATNTLINKNSDGQFDCFTILASQHGV